MGNLPTYSSTLNTAIGPSNQVVHVGNNTAPRTVQNRLADVIYNVKDFGAMGNGSTNDAAAIQAAIDAAYSSGANTGGKVVFLPAGTYNLGTTPLRITPNYSITTTAAVIDIAGAGRGVTILKGAYTGTLGSPTTADPPGLVRALAMQPINIDVFSGRTPRVIRDLTIWNTSTTVGTYALYFQFCTDGTGTSVGAVIDNVRLIGRGGLYFISSTFGGVIKSCQAIDNTLVNATTGVITYPTADQFTPLSLTLNPSPSGALGIAAAQACIIGNQAIGFDVGVAYCSAFSAANASLVAGNMASRSRIGFGLGYPGQGGGGSLVSSNWADRCQIGFYNIFSAGMVAGNAVTGTSGPADPSSVIGMSRVSSTVTVTTAVNHNIPSGTWVQLSSDLSGWLPTGNTTGSVLATAVTGTTFTFTSTNSGAAPTGASTWTYPCNFGMCCPAAIIAGNYVGSDASKPLTVSNTHLDFHAFGYGTNSLVLMATRAPTFGPLADVSRFANFATFKTIGCSSPSGSAPAFNPEVLVAGNHSALPLPDLAAHGFISPASLDKGDVFYVSDSVAANFGDTLVAELTTNASTASGLTQLHFASIPPNIVNGMFVDDVTLGDYPGIPAGATGTISGTNIVLSAPLTQTMPTGAKLRFSRGGGSTNRYKTRYDGVGFVRCG